MIKGIINGSWPAILAISLLFLFPTDKANAFDSFDDSFDSGAGSGFYLRGDTGYSWSRNAGFRQDYVPNNLLECFLYTNYPPAGPADCMDVLDNAGNSAIVGGGIGYRFNQNLRTDITYSYRGWYKLNEADLAGTMYTADITSSIFMLNGYYDIHLDGTNPYYGEMPIVPFFGAGVGYAHNKLGNIGWDDGVGRGVIPGGTWNGFAWQLMAGLTIPFMNGWYAELGYRYLDAGRIKKAQGNQISGPAWFTVPATGKLKSNEVTFSIIADLF